MAAGRRVALHRVIEISIEAAQLAELEAIARSRTEPACRVERPGILLAYRADPSTCAVGEAIGVTRQTPQHCLGRAVRLGVMAALATTARAPGKAPAITEEVNTWLLSLLCLKAKDLGYPHELWTTRFLAGYVREHAEAVGHRYLTRISQGTVCKPLNRHEAKPHKVRYFLERCDAAFEQKMARVLRVYREVAVMR